MLDSLILLIYHANSSLRKTGMFYYSNELKQRLADVWQSAAERY